MILHLSDFDAALMIDSLRSSANLYHRASKSGIASASLRKCWYNKAERLTVLANNLQRCATNQPIISETRPMGAGK